MKRGLEGLAPRAAALHHQQSIGEKKHVFSEPAGRYVNGGLLRNARHREARHQRARSVSRTSPRPPQRTARPPPAWIPMLLSSAPPRHHTQFSAPESSKQDQPHASLLVRPPSIYGPSAWQGDVGFHPVDVCYRGCATAVGEGVASFPIRSRAFIFDTLHQTCNPNHGAAAREDLGGERGAGGGGGGGGGGGANPSHMSLPPYTRQRRRTRPDG